MHTATGPSSVAGSPSAIGPSPAGGPPLADAGFAGLLATVAASQSGATPWQDDGLADDVASISYERALRSHARGRTQSSPAEAVSEPEGKVRFESKPLKTASITIRLSEPECVQLRRRAGEAGMTVSAYLRSCTLEVESLRAQVKQTLAEMRSSAPRPDREIATESSRGIRRFLTRLWQWCGQFGRRPNAILINPGNPFAPVRY